MKKRIIRRKPAPNEIKVLKTTDQLIHCAILNVNTLDNFVITYVCGFNLAQERLALWADLQDIATNMTEACCVLGDFNAILHSEDRMGGTEVTDSEIRDFTNCILNYELQEMRSTGYGFGSTEKYHDNLRPRLSQLNKNNYADLHKQKEKEKYKLEAIQQQIQGEPKNTDPQQREREARNHYISILSSAMDLLKQQSKLEWIKYGDDCTKLFFAKAKQRKLATYVYTITNEDGRQVEGFDQVRKVMLTFYKNLLGKQFTPRTSIDPEIERRYREIRDY
ncbi:hypothetical protein Cgig2_032985 [Carnegiea gigantea]|uniref:Endonuclease/exonuclease/phosphatase domain-containing protein n=1 Tax=Carnegiea gigantea TaxID=171969 RepID=A0A9Q1GHB3_9CARY|nr:hypothetical protein Cgig2_032985 [Carnegiea gigantea]